MSARRRRRSVHPRSRAERRNRGSLRTPGPPTRCRLTANLPGRTPPGDLRPNGPHRSRSSQMASAGCRTWPGSRRRVGRPARDLREGPPAASAPGLTAPGRVSARGNSPGAEGRRCPSVAGGGRKSTCRGRGALLSSRSPSGESGWSNARRCRSSAERPRRRRAAAPDPADVPTITSAATRVPACDLRQSSQGAGVIRLPDHASGAEHEPDPHHAVVLSIRAAPSLFRMRRRWSCSPVAGANATRGLDRELLVRDLFEHVLACVGDEREARRPAVLPSPHRQALIHCEDSSRRASRLVR